MLFAIKWHNGFQINTIHLGVNARNTVIIMKFKIVWVIITKKYRNGQKLIPSDIPPHDDDSDDK